MLLEILRPNQLEEETVYEKFVAKILVIFSSSIGICQLVRVKRRLQTCKMRTEGLTTDFSSQYVHVSCYFHYRVLTVNRIIHANHNESLQCG